MKANEIRIGNYVWNEVQQKAIQVNLKVLVDLLNGIDWQPIPLTEEWLLKFGFEKDEYAKDFRLGKYWVENRYFDSYEKSMFLFGCYQFNKIYITSNVDVLKYVHELQNLYFALTGEELTI